MVRIAECILYIVWIFLEIYVVFAENSALIRELK